MLMHYTHNLPHKFAGLMNLDDDETKQCMKEIETMWGVYLDLEEGAKTSELKPQVCEVSMVRDFQERLDVLKGLAQLRRRNDIAKYQGEDP